ncbi:MAG: hypothetical protein RLY46_679, partial [Bacteroidota bacterium]
MKKISLSLIICFIAISLIAQDGLDKILSAFPYQRIADAQPSIA